jgi:hypothetical protein
LNVGGTRCGPISKKAQHEKRTIFLLDETGFYLLPAVVRTLAPRGSRISIRVPLTRDHLSVIGGVTPEGKIAASIHAEALGEWEVILFLTHLLRHLSDRLLIVWDGSPIHRRSALVRLFLRQVGSQHISTANLLRISAMSAGYFGIMPAPDFRVMPAS